MIKISFPDGSSRDYESPASGLSIGQSISPSGCQALNASPSRRSANRSTCPARFAKDAQVQISSSRPTPPRSRSCAIPPPICSRKVRSLLSRRQVRRRSGDRGRLLLRHRPRRGRADRGRPARDRKGDAEARRREQDGRPPRGVEGRSASPRSHPTCTRSGTDRRAARRRDHHAVFAGQLHRPSPRPAPAERETAPLLQALTSLGRRLLARRLEEQAAHPRLRHRVLYREGTRRLPLLGRGTQEKRPPQVLGKEPRFVHAFGVRPSASRSGSRKA
ncbi:MAG: hypothetical protein MZU97_09495 [Bacillus subtilis]|nr:hypothetical protein [Bacillus subtilis]